MTRKTNAVEENQMLRPKDAAKRLGITKTTLYNWLSTGFLPVRPIRIGARATVFSSRELDSWVNSRPRTQIGEAPEALAGRFDGRDGSEVGREVKGDCRGSQEAGR